MLKRSFFTLLATTLLSFYSFSQTEISTREQFLSVIEQGLSGNYNQTADIVLGDLGTLNEAIINGTFTGTYNGNGYSISYSAAFHRDNSDDSNLGLFEIVNGTIQNLNIVNSYATLSGTGNDMNVGLICGLLNGNITNCHVMGDVNSTVTPVEGNGSDAGLIAGQLQGDLYCCSGVGNVSGVGYAGGLIGQAVNGSIKGCSFVGSVKAIEPSKHFGDAIGSNRAHGAYAGGISGYTRPDVNPFELCYVNADIEGAQGARGITNAQYNSNNTIRTINVTDCFAKGTVTSKGEGTAQGTETTMTTSVIDSDNEVTSGVSNYTTIYNSATDDNETNGSTTKSSLNGVRDAEDKTNFYFSRETGEVILVYGQNIGCEKPVFTAAITKKNSSGYFIYYYEVTFAESGTYEFTLKKGSEIIDSRSKANTDTIRIELGRGRNNNNLITDLAEGEYEFSAKRHCTSEDDQPSTSSIATYVSFLTVRDGTSNWNSTLGMDDKECTQPTSLSVSTTPTSATIAIEGFEANQAFRYNIDNEDYITGTGNTISLTGLNANNIYTVRVQRDCGNENYSLPFTIEFKTPPSDYETIKDGLFNISSTWNTNRVPDGENENITIKHNVQLTHKLTLSGTTTLKIDDENNNDDNTETAILIIDQLGQLINTTSNDILGIVEVKTPINQQKQWAFIGAPFKTVENNINNYKLESIIPVTGSDVVVSLYNDADQEWITDTYANYTSIVETGKGYFGYPHYTGAVTFTTYGDLWDWDLNNGAGGMGKYTDEAAKYKLNKDNVTITGKTASFVPLSNPYPAKLSVSKFLDNNQVQSVYKYNHSTQGFELVTENNTEIDIAEGFFVKLKPDVNSVTFSQTQLTAYPTPASKSQTAEREFVELVLTADNISSKLYFAHNEQAELGYDIFDADKLFAMTEMTEPYFLTQGIRLVKEEVNTLPYYATMNVRSYENKEVSFKANNIPQGIAVSLIDGEETIELNEGVVYTTTISAGENANRFKVLFSQSVGLNDVEELEVNITNDNRLVNITTSEKDLQIEVYNALGQRVFATKDFNFSLNNVSAGAYMIKAFNNKASKTQKIIIK